MKRNRSLNDDQKQFSLKRFDLNNGIILQDTKQEQSHSEINQNQFNLFNKRHIILKVQSWLDNIRSTNR
jgi:hypothetical protein